MELIQNSVKKREGKKWKQRWVVLRKDSLKSCQEVYYYLFFYKDEAHARDGKEKNTIPLADFCGLDFCGHYDKEENILILVTSSQTIYLAFDLLPERDHWKQTFIEHFGEAVTFKICIPDKQRLKAGDATIRLYPSFLSIITSNTYKCLNRWYLNDIERYSAVDSNHFMFEITSSLKTKGGHVINLLVNDDADDISRAFDMVASETRNNQSSNLVRTGSAMLDELGQARRNVGDQNFFRRAILRASERMRKKKRRNTANPPLKKTPCTNSIQQQENFRSLDRKKNPQISVELDNESLRKTMQIASQSSSTNNINGPDEISDNSPDNSRKRSNQRNENETVTTSSPDPKSSEPLVLDSVRANFENDTPSTPTDTNNEGKIVLDSGKDLDVTDGKEEILQGINLSSVETDKSDISVRNSRRSVDSFLSYKNPAKYAIAKTKGTNPKTKNEKTPTPPPRSPVSLGLNPNPCIFQFPPAEELEQDTVSKDICESESTSLNNNIKERKNDSESHDKFPTGTKMNNISPASWTSYDSDLSLRNDAYQNLPNFKDNSCSDYVSDLAARRNQRTDPLDCETWTKATGDGMIAVPSPVDIHPNSDYVNLESDELSYVNFSSSNKITLPDHLLPNRNKSKTSSSSSKSQQNEFTKYDDDDTSIYQLVSALNEGSYENVNGVRSSGKRNGNYLNVNKRLSPVNSKLTYIDLGLPDNTHKTTCASPMQMTPSYNRCDYTRIDVDATGAINRSMVEHRQQRDNPTNRTPTRFSR